MHGEGAQGLSPELLKQLRAEKRKKAQQKRVGTGGPRSTWSLQINSLEDRGSSQSVKSGKDTGNGE